MKVIQINAIYKEFSTGRTTMELHEMLLKRGYDSYVAAPLYANAKIDDSLYKIGNRVDHKVHALMSRLSGKQAYYSKKVTRKLLNWISQIQPDIIHLHNLHSNFINVPMLLRYINDKNLATVITLHDCWFYTGICTFYTAYGCERWKQECGECPAFKNRKISWFFDRSSEMLCDKRKLLRGNKNLAVVGVSKWVSQESKDSILRDARIHTHIYNWIDDQVFHPRDSMIRESLLNKKYKYISLSVATEWNSEKGKDDLIQLAKKMGDEFLFVLIGNIEDEDLPNNMLSVGVVTDINLLCEYYSSADVFIHLSIQETFGKVTAEALCCGTPVIVYDSTASPELVQPNIGRIVKPGDITGVMLALKDILKIGKENMQDDCVNFARDNFNLNNNVEAYLELYNNLKK